MDASAKERSPGVILSYHMIRDCQNVSYSCHLSDALKFKYLICFEQRTDVSNPSKA